MSQAAILNIIVTGTGGQGVFTLSNLIRELAANRSFKCEGATFKGGAQRMGSIHTELRILTDKNSDAHFSSSIPMGAVHVLIGMEPWEALRFANRCNSATKTIINAQEQRFYVERFQKTELMNPIESLEKIFTTPTIKNYELISKEESGDKKLTNYTMLKDAILNNYLPFTMEELEAIKIKK